MYLWNNYPSLRYLLSLILGIWIYDFHLEITPYFTLSIFSGLAILYFWLVARKYSLFLSGITILLMITLIGLDMAWPITPMSAKM